MYSCSRESGSHTALILSSVVDRFYLTTLRNGLSYCYLHPLLWPIQIALRLHGLGSIMSPFHPLTMKVLYIIPDLAAADIFTNPASDCGTIFDFYTS